MKAVMIAFLAVLTITTGCVSRAAAPAVTSQPPAYAMSEYRIQPGDLLDVKFFYNPELNESLTVRPDGRITLQLVNDVVAAGLTPAELTTNLTKAYAPELTSPRIAVIVKTSVLERVFVDGEVFRAGLVSLVGPTTVLQAISQAGGMKDSAKSGEVLLVRKAADNSTQVMRLDVKKLREGVATQDILLRPNDIVYVPKSTIANINTWIDMYIRKNVPLPVGIGYDLGR
uniref:Polysaccharide export protein n=1 Tax=Geobacter sp. (strain M21) TaxID=443144 RepID=C6E400_GEOSM